MPEPRSAPDIPTDGLKHDWELLDRYQAFSAELLRVSLLGIAGVGYLVTQLTAKDSTLRVDVTKPETILYFWLTLLVLGVAAAAALGHRYVSADSMACHIKLLRMRLREAEKSEAEKSDAKKREIEREKRSRDRRLKVSGLLLLIAALALGLGALVLALTFARLLASAA
jgi:DMSO reductase anchor subunit